jgi:acyl-coenzyme A synthetase/AMP-(fatty) acid ligase
VPKIFFAYGLGNSLTFPFYVGASAILISGQPKAKVVLQAITKYRPTLFFALSTLYNSFINADEASAANFSSIRLCLSAAEVLSPEVAKAWGSLTAIASWKAWDLPKPCTSTFPTRTSTAGAVLQECE